jgi:hypothetical protein
MSDARTLFRHTLATLAYRGGKTLDGAPDGFADFRCGETTRTPLEVLSHMGDLMAWVLSQARGDEQWNDTTGRGSWDAEVERFFAGLAALDAFMASDEPVAQDLGRLFQGAIADALTHVGQMAMLRRLAGSPVRGENYSRAEVVVGRVGAEQAAPRREFD